MELTTAQLMDFAGSKKCYEKAEQLVRKQSIVSLDIDDFSDDDLIMVHAVIKEARHYYEVDISIDKDDEVIRGHMCTCSDHIGGLTCVHCVAALIKIKMDQTKQAQKIQKESAQSYRDPIVADVMRTYEEQIVLSTVALNVKRFIHLEPIMIERSSDLFAVALRISVISTRSYAVKSIADFLADIAHNATRYYGESCEVLHNIQCFDEPSQRLVQFFIRHQHDSFYFTNDPVLQQYLQAKSMCLTPAALDEFFAMYVGCDVSQYLSFNKSIPLHFKKQNPTFSLTIQADEEGVFIATLTPMSFTILQGVNHIYILYNDTLYDCDYAFSKACAPILTTFLTKKTTLRIHPDVMQDFYHSVILSIQDYITILGDDLSSYNPISLITRVYLDLPKKNVVSARLLFCYGKKEYEAFTAKKKTISRDYMSEMITQMILTKYMTRIDASKGCGYIEDSQDAMYEFLSHGVDELNTRCEVYASEEFKKIQLRRVSISMGVHIKSNLLNIDFTTYDFPVDELRNVLDAYRRKKRYYRMKNGSYINMEDSALQELASVLDGIHVNESQIDKGRISVPKYRSLYVDQTLKDTNLIKVNRDASFKDIIRGIHNIADSDFCVPDALQPILRNYQKVGYRWLKTMAEYGFCGILADDMGIGKTLQVITLLEDEKLHHPTTTSLVICPSSLVLNWQSEIAKFSKTLTCVIVNGSPEERYEQIQSCTKYDIAVTSYDYLKRDIELYENICFTYEIIDEAQYIKNHKTRNAEAVKQINSLHRFALTGTPIENSLAELWSIFDYLMPGYLFTYSYFKKEFEAPIVRDQNEVVLKELKHLVEPFILRRIKKDVLKELPEKAEHTMMIELDVEARKLYMATLITIRDDLRKKYKGKGFENNKFIILQMLTRLRQICCDPRLLYENYQGVGSKIFACIEYIESCIASNKKVLLFSQFTSLLALMEKELIERGISYYLLKGSTPKITRQQYVNAFNTDDTPVFLISLKAGGTGLNLTSAEVVIHFDPWWNVSAQNQATDRAYRIGQHNNVQVVKLIAKNTIEERILQLQEQKLQLGDSVIEQNDGLIRGMSKDELLDLFSMPENNHELP